MAFQQGDGKYTIIRKLLESVGGTWRPGDTLRGILAKYLTAVGGTPLPGDHYNVVLAKIVRVKGGTPTPGDQEWDLLVKWLQAEGECPKCGGSVIELWKQILALPAGPEPVVPFNVVAVKGSNSTINVTWEADSDPETEWIVQVIACDQLGSPLIDVTRDPIERSSSLVNFPTYPDGDWLVRIRDANSDSDEWVVSNCLTFGCNTLRDQKTGVTTGNVAFDDGGIQKYAVPFVAGANETLCKAILRLSKVGTPAGFMTVGIWSDSGGTGPLALLGTAADIKACPLAPTSEGDVTFINLNVTLVSGTTYWVVLTIDAAQDASNYIRWHYVAAPGTNVWYDIGGFEEVAFDVATKYALYSA